MLGKWNEMFVYSVFDKKTHAYEGLMLYANIEIAKRAVSASFNPQSLFVLYPSDYRLDCIGVFDPNNGDITSKVVSHVDIVDLIPDKFKSFALDGSFTNRTGSAGDGE